MAIAPIRIPRLQQGRQIVDGSGYPATDFLGRLNEAFASIEEAFNSLLQLPVLQQAIQDAQAAADAANLAAQNAQTAADTAQNATNQSAAQQALINSYISPDSVLTANTVSIAVAAHTRIYADGTTAAISASTVSATGAGDTDYVFYNAPIGTSGAVTFQVSTTPPAQLCTTHVVGAVTIPTSGTASGGSGPRQPGTVDP